MARHRLSEPEISEEDLEVKAVAEMMEKEDKQFSNYLSVQAELKLQKKIETQKMDLKEW